MEEMQKTKNGKTVWIILAAVAVILIALCAVFFMKGGSEESYRNIKVIDTIGNVMVQRGSTDSMSAYNDMNLQSGDDVSVGQKSELDMKLDDDKFVYASENTHMIVESTGTETTSNVKITMDEGSVLHKVDRKLENGSTYEIETPNATMAIRGTIVSADVYTDQDGVSHTTFSFYEGKGELQLHKEDGTPVGDPIQVPQGYSCNVVCDGDEPQLDGDMSQIDYDTVPTWIVDKLDTFMADGRTIYSGDNAVTAEEMDALKNPAQNDEQPTAEDLDNEDDADDQQSADKPQSDNNDQAQKPAGSSETPKKPSSTSDKKDDQKKPTTDDSQKPQNGEDKNPTSDDKNDKPADEPADTPENPSVDEPTDNTPTNPSETQDYKQYNIIFMYQKGGDDTGWYQYDIQAVKENNAAQKPNSQPTSAGSWKTGVNGQTYDFSKPVTSNVILYWVE